MNKETKIQRAIQEYLKGRRIFHFRVNADSSTVGIPDIIACYRGCFVGIEVKTKTGKPSEMQLTVADEIKNNLGYVVFPTCVGDVINILEVIDASI